LKKGRAGISVMFMTFIAISILSAIFLTYYLYLTQQNLSATEAQRIYAEAAQERIEVILDRRAREILVNNTGGIGVTIKYLVGLDRSGATASLRELQDPIVVPAGGHVVLTNVSTTFPELYVFRFEIEAYPSNITLGNASSTVVTLKLKATLLETPEKGVILIVADPSRCRMTNITTTTRIANITYNTTTIIAATKAIEGWICTSPNPLECLNPTNWNYVTFVVEPTTMTAAADVSAVYTTETLTRSDEWIEPPEPITLTFTTKTRTTMTTFITISARALDYWDESAQCFIWFRVLNATSGSRLAEAGVRASAGTAIATTTTEATTTTTATAPPGIRIELSQESVTVNKGGSTTVTVTIYSENGYSGSVTLSATCDSGPVCNQPGALSFTFSGNPVEVSPEGPATSILTITAANNAPPSDKTNTVTVTGEDTAQGVSDSIVINVNVERA